MSSEPRTIPQNRTGAVDRPYFVDIDDVFEIVSDVFGPKWHLRIVYSLLEEGELSFSDLKYRLEGVSSKMLSESLSSLESYGLVAREIVSDQPLRVEYSLTEQGMALESALDDLVQWHEQYDIDTTGDR